MNELIVKTTPRVNSFSVKEGIIDITDCEPTAEILLNAREQEAIVLNFQNGFYDVMSEFVWNRTISVLRDRLMLYGESFIGDMLGYDGPISSDRISETEIIELNYELGYFGFIQKKELLHNAEQINIYSSRQNQLSEQFNFTKNQAMALVETCVKSVLTDMRETDAVELSDVRKKLRTEILSATSVFVSNLKQSGYFIKRTILRSLINMTKIDKEEEKQIVYQNTTLIVPAIWNDLSENDKYSFGMLYAEVSNTESLEYINILKTVLLNVQGFDYVPENLKSRSFINAAKNLLSVHYKEFNFYNEPLAAKMLAHMGSGIPDPALTECLNATIICITGNGFGYSRDAQIYLESILDSLTTKKWEKYLKELELNSTLLFQLGFVGNDYRIAQRWSSIVSRRSLNNIIIQNKKIVDFMKVSATNDYRNIKNQAQQLYKEGGFEQGIIKL